MTDHTRALLEALKFIADRFDTPIVQKDVAQRAIGQVGASLAEPVTPWTAVMIAPEDNGWDAWEIWEGDKCISSLVMGATAAQAFVAEHNRGLDTPETEALGGA
jgi:hypothetical protein